MNVLHSHSPLKKKEIKEGKSFFRERKKFYFRFAFYRRELLTKDALRNRRIKVGRSMRARAKIESPEGETDGKELGVGERDRSRRA